MTKPKLYILPAHAAPALILPEEPSWPVRRTRIYDANGTEFVGIVECSVRMDPDNPATHRRLNIELRLERGESLVLDAPPGSLQDRLRALVGEWLKVERFEAGDDMGRAAKKVRMDCAEELEKILDAIEAAP